MQTVMQARKLLAIFLLVLSSFAVSGAKPEKSELESMYDKAFRAFDSAQYGDALKALDAIDARQPDLAESYNLRGVVYMRQEKYDKAETALRKALSIEPRFWNASFNLAEIPFLKKDWVEARNRFTTLMAGENEGLQPETSQLIQYKILLTFVLQGKENTVDWILNKFEQSKGSPALYYSNAAIAFHRGNEKEAKEWLSSASKQFSAPLNKLYAESFYEVGWMAKPAGESRAALEITSTTERAERLKADAKANFEKAERAFQQRDFENALQSLELAEAGAPNDPPALNLRGEILMEQKKYDEAEVAFRKAFAADPKLREAQYNLAQVPFKKGEYGKARDRFETLFAETPGGDKNQAAQLIRYKIFMTLLLDGREQQAKQMMDQFQFTGDTPALYYAQAAWEFKHAHPDKGQDWVSSARKIYSPALNIVFADSFYDMGWLESAPTGDVPPTSALAQADATPPTGDKPALRFGQAEIAGQELDENGEAKPAATAAPNTVAAVASPTAKPAVTAATKPKATAAPVVAAAATPAIVASSASPAAATETTAGWSRPTFAERLDSWSDSRSLLVAGLLLAGILLLVWLVVSQFRRNLASVPVYDPAEPLTEPPFGGEEPMTGDERRLSRDHLASGPPKVSVQLTAGEPSVRTAILPSGAVAARAATPGTTEPPAVPPGQKPELKPTPASAPPTPPPVRPPTPAAKPPFPEPAPMGRQPEPPRPGQPPFRDLEEISMPKGPITAVERPKEKAPEPMRATPPAPPVPPVPMPAAAKSEEPADIFNKASTPPAKPADTVKEPVESGKEPVAAVTQPVDAVRAPGEAVKASGEAVKASAEAERAPGEAERASAEAEGAPGEAERASAVAEKAPGEAEKAPGVAAKEPVEAPKELVEAPKEPVEAAKAPVEEFEAPIGRPKEPVEAAEAPVEAAQAPVETPKEPVEAAKEAAGPDKAPAEVPVPPIAKPAAPVEEPVVAEKPFVPWPKPAQPKEEEVFEEPVFADEEPVGQGQPIPHLTTAFSPEPIISEMAQPEPESELVLIEPEAGLAAPMVGRQPSQSSIETPSFASKIITTEPIRLQPTTSAIMPETSITPAPASRPSSPTVSVQQPVGGMHTAVQLTFALEIASMQLTPTFKMSGLQLKPMSKVVSMRLAPSQDPQPPMNLQVTFEVAKIDLNNGAIGTIRLTPSGEQKPALITSPSFAISGLELMAGSGAAPVQLTPSHQEQASVQLTAEFQIAAIEFTPLFEIATIVLNATSKKVSMQLPGAGPSTIDNAPVFEIENVQVGEGGSELGMIQVTPGRGA